MASIVMSEDEFFHRDLKGRTYILYAHADFNKVFNHEGAEFKYSGGMLKVNIVRDANGNLAFNRIEDDIAP